MEISIILTSEKDALDIKAKKKTKITWAKANGDASPGDINDIVKLLKKELKENE